MTSIVNISIVNPSRNLFTLLAVLVLLEVAMVVLGFQMYHQYYQNRVNNNNSVIDIKNIQIDNAAEKYTGHVESEEAESKDMEKKEEEEEHEDYQTYDSHQVFTLEDLNSLNTSLDLKGSFGLGIYGNESNEEFNETENDLNTSRTYYISSQSYGNLTVKVDFQPNPNAKLRSTSRCHKPYCNCVKVPYAMISQQDVFVPPKCQRDKKVFYLKTFKTGSTTMLNILFRYALETNKRVLMLEEWCNKYNGNYLWNHLKGHIANSRYARYDMFMEHVLYDRKFLHRHFPKNVSFYFTSVREPYKRLESHIGYFGTHMAHIFKKFHLSDKARLPLGTQFIRHLKTSGYFRQAMSRPRYDLFTNRNSQTRQLGLNFTAQDNITAINLFLDRLDFDYFLVTEHYDEGLILLKRKLCLPLENILYLRDFRNRRVRKRKTPYNQKELGIIENAKKEFKKYSMADYMLYERANQTFWNNYNNEVGIQEELNHFREIREVVQQFCDMVVYGKSENATASIVIPVSIWNPPIYVDKVRCMLMRTFDVGYRQIFSIRQHPNYCGGRMDSYCQHCERCCRFLTHGLLKRFMRLH